MTEKEWIEKVAPAAVYCSKKYGYPASALIGQTCQETGYGKTKLVEYNNVIGMKTTLLPYTSTTWPGDSVIKGTWEEVNGSKVDKNDSFRIYNSIQDCLEDFCQFMREGKEGGRYKYRMILSWGDPEKVLRFITGKYATDHTYADKVLAIIDKHELRKYDGEQLASVHNISNCGHDENGQYSGGAAGDQTGTEWEIKAWYDRPWDVVLEPPTRAAADTIAELAIEAANNNMIGYDQGNRTSFDAMLIKYGNYPKNIKEACETDCSAGVAAIVRATGRILKNAAMQAVSKDAYTGNLEKALTAAGFKAHREARFRTSPDYLGNGWILLYTGHHTAISVSRGSKWEDEMSKVRDLRRGCTGEDVRDLQVKMMLHGFCDCQDYKNPDKFCDADFGPRTEAYVMMMQEALGLDNDGVVGPLTRAELDKLDAIVAASDTSKIKASDMIAAAAARTKIYAAEKHDYGNPPIAPQYCRELKVACDRGVDEFGYDAGFKDIGNRECSTLDDYFVSKGGTIFTDLNEARAGDILWTNNGNHVFLCAGTNKRFDCGSKDRIQLTGDYSGYTCQPFTEPVVGFWRGVHPAYAPEQDDGKLYQVQAGLFEVRANAEKKVAQLNAAGFPALIIEIEA